MWFVNAEPLIGLGTAVATTVDGLGYLMAGASGTVYSFGDAPNFGGIPQQVPSYTGTVLGMTVQALPTS